jgi:hypothetical protein
MFVSDKWLINTAGYQRVLQLFASGGTGPGATGRGLFVSIRGNIMIAIVGSTVFSISPSLVITTVGNLATETGEVFIDENLNAQICIVDGVNAYIYNYQVGPVITIQAITGSLIPNYVEYHNTFFLFGNANMTSNGAAWYVYQFDTPTTIVQVTAPGGQFALQTKPDFALAVVRLPGRGNNVLVLGSSVCEIWLQVGGLQNYRRNSNINIDYGVASISTIAKSDQYVVWLGINESNAPVIMVFAGESITPISSDGIDYELSQIQFPDQSTATLFRQDGHLFYQLTFYNPVDNVTYLYDFTSQTFFNLSDAALNYHPAREYVYFNGKTYFISLNNGSIYQSSSNYTTYNENLPTVAQDPTMNLEIQRIRVCDTVMTADSSQFRANTFVFIIEQGQDTLISGVSLLNNEDLLITEDAFAPPDDVIYTEFGVPMADEDSGAGVGAGDLPPPYQPRVDMSISRDGGITWSNTVARNLNPVAIRQNIINWENLGSANSLTIKLRFWGLSRFVCNNGWVEVY